VIDDELRPAVIEFVAEMLNDPHCESILLDFGEDAMVDSDLPVLYLDIVGKQYGCTLSIVGEEYSASIRDCDTNETITTMKGRELAWELQELFNEIKTKLWEDK
jgi:hypothetical protein